MDNNDNFDYYNIWHEKEYVDIPKRIIPHLEEMLADLQNNYLEVCLVPDRDTERYENNGCQIRTTSTQNVQWYRELCKMHPKPEYKKGKNGKLIRRRFRKKQETNLKKMDVVRIIKRMIKNKKSKSQDAPYLLEVAEQYMETYLQNEKDLTDFLEYELTFPVDGWDDENPPF